MADPLQRWLAERAPAVLDQAEAEAVALLRDHLVRAALSQGRNAPDTPADPGHAPAPQGAPPPATSGSGELLWAYCVVEGSAGVPLDGLRAVGGHGPVERIESSGLAVLVSRVPRDVFDAEPLRVRLNDLEWLEEVARAHELVLDGAMRATTIVPLRLCTIYERPERVRAMLAGDRLALTDALRFLAGREEWGAKLTVDPERLLAHARTTSPEACAADDDLAGRSEGGAYLKRRRLDRHLREHADQLAVTIAHDVHERLRRCAVDAATRAPQNRDLSGHEGDMILNAAYLIDDGAVEALRAEAATLEAGLGHVGGQITVTGPWPPYNFLPRHGAAAQP